MKNKWWWASLEKCKADRHFYLYTEDKELARKIARNEKKVPATYHKDGRTTAWQFYLPYKRSRFFDKIMRWAGT